MSMKRNNSPFFDGRLLHRVRAIVNTKSCLDSEEIATRLQNLHSEYSRRKRGPFIKLVARACEVISRENDMGDDEIVNIDSDDDLDITPSSPQPEGPNIMNSMMSNMYGKMPKNIPLSPIYASCSREDSRNSSTCGSDTKQNLSMNEDSVFFIDKKGSNSSSTLNQSLNKSVQLNATTEEKKMPQSEINTEKKTEKTPKKRKGQGRERDDESLPSKKNKGPEVQTSSVTFNDFGGNEKCLIEICKLLVHMNHPEVYQQIGVTPPRGFLLHGPPGCGKTLLAHAVVGELGLPFLKVAAPELVSGVSGESEQKVRDLFDKAISLAPCIVFIDEIDAITPKREVASKDMEKRIVAQLLYCMDELSKKENAHVLVIGATNRVDSLDPALRRAGRFDREVCLGIPNENARKKILQVLCKGLRIQEDFDYEYFAKNTPGFVGADLSQFVRESAMTAVNRVFDQIKKNNDSKNSVVTEKSSSAMEVDGNLNVAEVSKCDSSDEYLKTLYWLKNSSSLTSEQMEEIYITFEDFNKALKHVQPSAKREGFATVPDVTWDDIGALNLVREDLQLAILAPVRHAKQFENLGLSRAQGILLAGPPGCGKTLLAKAIANESGINFISVKGPELLNMYVGESERAVRLVFQRARNSAPCVIFFDELDALCPRRTDSGEGGSSVRVVNQLLTEMDGLEDRKQVYIIGATNRPDIIDPAILRPGRLDRTIYVGLPTPEDRLDIMRAITKQGTKPKFTPDVDLKNIANDERCSGFTGADMAALIREASLCALRDVMKSEEGFLREVLVTGANFESAFLRVKPSISKRDMFKYEKMKDNLAI